MAKGWVSIHRELQDHWLWQEKRVFSKLEAWFDILLTVNHSEQKVMIKNTLYIVKRGDSIKCLDTWGKRWNWNKSKVRRFLVLLEKDSMIVTKNETKTTRLTVCKYDSYQTIGNANETQMKHSRNADETQMTPNNNTNNNNNINSVIEDLQIFEPPKLNNLTEELFLKRWCDARIYYDKLPTNIKKLTTFEKIDFNELRQDYGLKDFERAMKGMFQQKTFPKTRLRPSHFLKREHFETYLTCFTTNEKLFEDKKYKKPIERI